jgi:mycoredoxin
MALTVYTATWCGPCKRLKSQLTREGIGYQEIDVEQDPRAAEFVISVNGGNRVIPTVVFADGTTATNPSVIEVKARLSALSKTALLTD